MAYHNDQAFSTHDRDNDRKSSNCAVERHGAWWYDNCGWSNLNGKYYHVAQSSSDGVAWYYWKDSWHSMKRASMKIRPNT